MRYLSRSQVEILVTGAIAERMILEVQYRHVDDGEIVKHTIAPFDIGTTNPKYQERSANNLYAYSYTHLDEKTSKPAPKVCTFNISRFIDVAPSGKTFDENDLADRNKAATKYDYRSCKFAILPNRDWFRKR